MRISDWSSDVCSSDLVPYVPHVVRDQIVQQVRAELGTQAATEGWSKPGETPEWTRRIQLYGDVRMRGEARMYDKNNGDIFTNYGAINHGDPQNINDVTPGWIARSEEHTSALQSLMRISYAVFCF